MAHSVVVQELNLSKSDMQSIYRKGLVFQVSLKSREAEKILQQRTELMDYYKMDASGLMKHLIAKEHYVIRRQLNLV